MPIEDVILTTDNCRYCLMCRHVAPVEHVTQRESLSPHGIALVIASVRRGLLQWNTDTVDVIYSASDNGNSRAHCVFDQPLPEAIAAVRAELVTQKFAPTIVYELDARFDEWSNPFEQQKPKPVTGRGDVALFVGDEAQYLWPAALTAALSLLKAVGVSPVLIGAGRSNGFLPSSLGLPETARRLAQATLADLETSGARRMLVLSPGDLFTFNQLYDERLGIEWPASVQLSELTTFLADCLEGGEIKFKTTTQPAPYAYIDQTHAVRVPARHARPRQLLAGVFPGPTRELFWRCERAHPVGNTALQFSQPDIAEKLTLARLEDARQSGARVLICDDPGTLKTLDEKAGQFGLRIQGMYELLAEQLN